MKKRVNKKLTVILLRVFILVIISILTISCNKKPLEDRTEENLVVVTDQGTKRLLVLDPMEDDWNGGEAVKWSWRPSASNGFTDNDAINGWRLPSDVRIRNSKFFGGMVMLVCDSDGLAAIIPYPEGTYKHWSINTGKAGQGANNLHAIELLPDGNVAIAASNGGWVRVYTSSQGADAAEYVQYDLPQAHGVLWDPSIKRLWVLGDDYLTGLKVLGTAKEPILEEDMSLRAELPTRHGHDLQPVYGNKDRLWVTTGSRVYQYIKSKKAWERDYPGAIVKGGRGIDRGNIKSVGNNPFANTVILTQAIGVTYSWCTDQVDFIHLKDEPEYEAKVRTEMAIYKARYMNPDYQ